MSNLPPFTPVQAPPVQPAHVIDGPDIPASKRRKAKPKAAKVPKKKQAAMLAAAKEAIQARGVNPAPAKRQRSARVAPLTMNAEQALAALAGLGRVELSTMQALVALLNPLPRAARKRVLEAVASITSGK